MFCILPKAVFLSDFLRGIPSITPWHPSMVSDIRQGVQTEALAEEPGAKKWRFWWVKWGPMGPQHWMYIV